MSDGLRVEVRVRGRLDGDLLALVGGSHELRARVVPRHTVLTVGPDAGPAHLLQALQLAGIELDRVLPRPRAVECPDPPSGGHPASATIGAAGPAPRRTVEHAARPHP